MDKPKVLVIDEQQAEAINLRQALTLEGCEVATSLGGPEALHLLAQKEYDLVLTELHMPRVSGMEILARVRKRSPDTEVIMTTGSATIGSAIAAIKLGAHHYLTKPYNPDELRQVVREALEKRRLKVENRKLRERLDRTQGVKIIAEDPVVRELLATARQVARSDCSVLLTGESGTGKELLARFIHENSLRAGGPLKAVNCGVFTEELLANELFGHEKGAFTGADTKKTGLIESAQSGTVFLDEITEMSPAMQVKLLRAIQEKEVLPVGAVDPIKVDVRFIAATNRDISQMVKSGKFRQDLFFRINVMNLHLPPLAERRKDVPLLTQYFIDKYSSMMNKPVRRISPEARRLLQQYDFPGNVRELENIIERAVVLARGEQVEVGHLPDMEVHTYRPTGNGAMPSLEDQERDYIQWVLKQTGGNKTRAAEILGIDRVSLWRKLKKFALE
ncbi:MAG: sigma-54 dependent transcriptional regulator [Deltaproteobacteria bacterium]|jgi:two-component system response regulator HydG